MTDRNLLFGVLVLQADLIDVPQFAEACTVWASRKTVPLSDVLIERGWLSSEDASHVEYLVERHLRQGRHADALLLRLPTAVKESLLGLGDPEIRQSLGEMPTTDDASTSVTSFDCPESRYSSRQLHAVGGIGRVWLARDTHLGRDVALKELKPEQQNNRAAKARFLREAQITGQLEHPGIVPVYDLARHEGNHPFYTMRFVKGRTMSEATSAHHAKRREGQEDSLEFLGLLNAFVTVCNTVAYAHSRGIIHRDLKGQNVVLGDFGEVMVLDWGLAKAIEADSDETNTSTVTVDPERSSAPDLTRQGQALGTPAYMAPEQAAGSNDRIDERTDVYGLGAMLYEILTGRPPYSGVTTREVLDKVLSETPIAPRHYRVNVPPLLEAACLRALDKNPVLRFSSAADLGREVQQWQEVERRQAEEALRQSEALYHSLVETIPMIVWRKDTHGRYTFVNRGFIQNAGRAVDQILGKTDFDLVSAELAKKYNEGDNWILSTGDTYRATEELEDADGRRFTIQVVKLPIHDSLGRIVGTQGIVWPLMGDDRAAGGARRV
jgi:PAS domain S-box-containing protein